MLKLNNLNLAVGYAAELQALEAAIARCSDKSQDIRVSVGGRDLVLPCAEFKALLEGEAKKMKRALEELGVGG